MKHLLKASVMTGLLALGLAGCGGQQSVGTAETTSAFVTIDGQNLLKPDGTPLFIMGTNLGNWLNPEGYMFNFTRTNSAHFIDEMLCQLVGPDFAARFWRQFKDNYVTREDIRFIKSTGANTIRLPFHYKLFTDEDYMGLTAEQDGFAVQEPRRDKRPQLVYRKDAHQHDQGRQKIIIEAAENAFERTRTDAHMLFDEAEKHGQEDDRRHKTDDRIRPTPALDERKIAEQFEKSVVGFQVQSLVEQVVHVADIQRHGQKIGRQDGKQKQVYEIFENISKCAANIFQNRPPARRSAHKSFYIIIQNFVFA